MEKRIIKKITAITACLILINCSTIPQRKGVTQEEYDLLVWQSVVKEQNEVSIAVKNIVGNNPVAIYVISDGEYSYDLSLYQEQFISQTGGVIVATRRTDVLDREFNFQLSGRVSDEEMRSLGMMYGATYILVIDHSTSLQPTNSIDDSIWRYTLYDIERGLVLYTSVVAMAQKRLLIDREYYVIQNIQDMVYSQAATWADEAVDRGINFLYAGNLSGAIEAFTDAIEAFTEAIRLVPNNGEAYRLRGEAYLTRNQSGDLEQAIDDLTQAIRFDPNHPAGYYLRGNAYRARNQSGDIDRAIANYTQAIRIFPNHSEAYLSRGVLYFNRNQSGDLERAIADMEAVLRIQPDNTTARDNLAFLQQQRGK